jgi:AraC family transcriptional regulator of adaptative response / DNA-3-methyladenine glycosylase II
MATELIQDNDACYRALETRDARFDGRLFVGVTSTGIYCRPVCRVRTPKPAHCRFFALPAQAEQAGFRPCLRCRPELAPADRHWSTHDAGQRLLAHALQWLDNPAKVASSSHGCSPLPTLCRELGISDRHLRRLFADRLGLPPLRYLQTRRLLTAKLLLTDTRLPVAEVALASGFGSVRRFNDVFVQAYGLEPGRFRRGQPLGAGSDALAPKASLAWRPPMDVEGMVTFLRRRLVAGNEWMDPAGEPVLLKAVRLPHQGRDHRGWIRLCWRAAAGCVRLETSPSLVALLPQLIWRVRRWLDLDTDTGHIDRLLERDFPGSNGMRLPGGFDPFELGVRAILGQQVSMAVAGRLTARLVEALGDPVETPQASVMRLFPTAEQLARTPADRLGELGIVRQRQQALLAFARACATGTLDLEDGSEPRALVERLVQLPGIGAWTAHYLVMRASRWSDAWLPSDAALRAALPSPQGPRTPTELQALAQRWRPWRSYAVLRAWTRPPEHPVTQDVTGDPA